MVVTSNSRLSVSRKGNAVLTPVDDDAAWQKIAYLVRSPANACRLLDAYDRARAGRVEAHDLVISQTKKPECIRPGTNRRGRTYEYWQTADRKILKRIKTL